MDECATVPPLAADTDRHLIACWLTDATKHAAPVDHASAGDLA
jgi:hypothetical protein